MIKYIKMDTFKLKINIKGGSLREVEFRGRSFLKMYKKYITW